MIASLLLVVGAVAQDLPRLVTVEWLAAHRKDPGLVLFQIGDQASRPAYDAGHVPGSQFLNPFAELAAPRAQPPALVLELPSLAQLDSVLEAKGVSDDSRIVLIHAKEYFSPTSRAALTLEYAGFAGRVAILDGGLEAWQAAGQPVTTEVPTPAPGRFTPRPNPSLIATIDQVAKSLEDKSVAVIDARAKQFYDGGETRQGRNGHIPGATNIPFPTVIDEGGKFKDVATLRAMFREAGAEPGDRIITYCHIGQQATLVWFAARLAGYEASMFDGSFQQWAQRTELPVVGPAAAKP